MQFWTFVDSEKSCIPGINPTWLWCVIFIIYIEFSLLIVCWGLLHLWASLVAQTVKNSPPISRRPGFDHWVGKIPWSRDWLPIPVFLPGEFHGQRSLAGCSRWGLKEYDITERLTHTSHSWAESQHSFSFPDKELIGPAQVSCLLCSNQLRPGRAEGGWWWGDDLNTTNVIWENGAICRTGLGTCPRIWVPFCGICKSLPVLDYLQ